jgi:hypothetical protein
MERRKPFYIYFQVTTDYDEILNIIRDDTRREDTNYWKFFLQKKVV